MNCKNLKNEKKQKKIKKSKKNGKGEFRWSFKKKKPKQFVSPLTIKLLVRLKKSFFESEQK